jgi:hypothetical protein
MLLKLNVNKLSIDILSVIMSSFNMLNLDRFSVIMTSVVMLNVVAPGYHHHLIAHTLPVHSVTNGVNILGSLFNGLT